MQRERMTESTPIRHSEGSAGESTRQWFMFQLSGGSGSSGSVNHSRPPYMESPPGCLGVSCLACRACRDWMCRSTQWTLQCCIRLQRRRSTWQVHHNATYCSEMSPWHYGKFIRKFSLFFSTLRPILTTETRNKGLATETNQSKLVVGLQD